MTREDRPRIGITTSPRRGDDYYDPYRQAVKAVGAEPVDLPPGTPSLPDVDGQARCARRQVDGLGAHRLDRLAVGVVVVVASAGTGCDTDPRPVFTRHRFATRLRATSVG